MLYLPAVMHQRRTTPRGRWRAAPLIARAGALAVAAALLALLALFAPRRAAAHEVPPRVGVLAYAQPVGDTLRLLLRVPLEAMRDLDVPVRSDGTLDIPRMPPVLAEAARLWLVDYLRVEADGVALAAPRIVAARLALPEDRSFATLATALAALAAPPLDSAPGLRFAGPWLDVRLDYGLPHPGARLALRPALAHLGQRTTTVLHVIGADGTDRVVTYDGDPGHLLLDPGPVDAAVRFVREGIDHILGGLDHLLFLLCLVLPIRRWRTLVGLITAFTAAHSLTLGAAALGFAPTAGWFPPLVETLIALSIVWLAVENVLLPADRLAGRWAMAFGFGLVHGFGFAVALGNALQFAGRHLVVALGAFNLGVELGQLAVLAVTVPVLRWALRRLRDRERVAIAVGSVLVGHIAWHWMTTRGADLAVRGASMTAPAFDAVLGLAAMRLALLAACALALGLAVRHFLRTFRLT